MPKQSSLREIAQELGLSVPTVSRALGGYSDIAQATRERVAETARRLGYVPNSAARMLASGKSGFVGLVVPVDSQQMLDAYLGAIIAGVSDGLAQRDLQLMIAAAPEGESPLDTLRRIVDARRIDGVILTRIAPEDPRISFLQDRDMPFVAQGRQREGLQDHNWLDVDDGAAFAQAVTLLAELGHRDIALVSITDKLSLVAHREAAARDAATRLGLRLKITAAPRADRTARLNGIAELLNTGTPPTAILGLFDHIALDTLRIAAELGFSVPSDLSVIGFDDVSGAAYSSPPLSTFNPDNRQLGRRAAEMMDDILAGRAGSARHVLTKADFVARSSHGPVPLSRAGGNAR